MPYVFCPIIYIRVKVGVPIHNFDVFIEIIYAFASIAVIGCGANEVIEHPAGVALCIQHPVQVIHITGKIRIAPIRVIQIDLVRTDGEVGAARIFLKEVGNVGIELEDERLCDILLNGNGSVVGCRRARTSRACIVDAAIHRACGICLTIICKAVAGVVPIILLKLPGQIVHVGGAVKGGNHSNMILLRDVKNLHKLRCGKIFACIGIISIWILYPVLDMAAANPGEIVFRMERTLIILRIPEVCPEAAVFREMQLQRIVAHPGHFLDKVADPILGQILTGTVQHDGALLCIGRVRSGKAVQRVAVGITEVLMQHIQAVQQAVHIRGCHLGGGGNVQFVAFRANTGVGIQMHNDIAGLCPVSRSPHDGKNLFAGPAVSRELPLNQLNRLQKASGWLSLTDNIEPAAAAKRKRAVLCLIGI